MTTGVSVRVLASPGFVLALVVLVLNDHVLKQASPGTITGKLSDVAGLVVAPILLAVVLSALRAPRPLHLAMLATGLGFVLVKSSASGAAVVSEVWSLSGIDTTMRADVTDLLALPALYGAWLVHRRSVTTSRLPIRRILATATGVAMLPVAVLATAATNCSEIERITEVALVAGSFTDTPSTFETRAIVSSTYLWYSQVDRRGEVAGLPPADRMRLEGLRLGTSDRSCDEQGTCWRIAAIGERRIEISTDGGETWETDLEVSDNEAEEAMRGVQGGCGREPVADLRDLVIVGHGRSASVVVGASSAGVLVRKPDGDWELFTLGELSAAEEPAPGTRLPKWPLRPEPAPTPSPTQLPPPGETPSLPPEPTCEAPVTVSVTPDPRNGPPTTNVYCP